VTEMRYLGQGDVDSGTLVIGDPVLTRMGN
jgi:hypothetical protein